MFSLISGAINWYFSKIEVKILVLGLDNAGKTTFLESLKLLHTTGKEKAKGIPLDRILPTIGLNMGRLQAHGCDVTLWDLGGQQSFRSIWDKYYDDAEIIIYVFDSADEDRFDEAIRTLNSLLEHPQASKLPVLILGNKCDLPLAHDVNALDQLFNIDTISTSRIVKVMAASAFTSIGCDKALQWVVDTIKVAKENEKA